MEARDALPPAESTLIDLMNIRRQRAGLAPVRLEERLTRAAQLHAEQMAAAGRMAHTLDDVRYPRMEDRLDAADYPWRVAGENLAFGQHDAGGAVDVWMQSPPHRANVLNPQFTEAGAAHIADDNGRQYYVVVFGRPSADLSTDGR